MRQIFEVAKVMSHDESQIKLVMFEWNLNPLKFDVSNASQVFLPLKTFQVPLQQSTSASAGRSFEPQEAETVSSFQFFCQGNQRSYMHEGPGFWFHD